MKNWVVSLLAFLVLFAPAAYLLTDVIVGSYEIHITAVVPEPTSDVPNEQNGLVSNTSSGGSGAGFVASSSGQSSSSTNNSSDGNTGSGSSGASTSSNGGGASSTEGADSNEIASTNGSSSTSGTSSNPEVTSPPEPQTTSVSFGGYAFPGAIVHFQLNGETVVTVNADENGYFESSYPEVQGGENVFSFQAESYSGTDSRLVSYVYTVQPEAPVYITSVLLPPLLGVSSSGTLDGVAIPGSSVQIYGIDRGDQSYHSLGSATVNPDGTYQLDLSLGEKGYNQYYVSCTWKSSDCGYSGIVNVQTVGASNLFVTDFFADFTSDVKVNYVDFAFIRSAYLDNANNPLYDLNQNGKIDLADFSLLNYQWSQ